MLRPGDTILFQGDSITDAFRKPEEINLSFQLGSGFAFLAASDLLLRHPSAGLQFYNRGVSGNTVGKILERWQEDALDLSPDVVSLLAGVNDTLYGVPHDETDRNYRTLLERTRRHLPQARIILLEPFLLPAGAVTPEQIEDIKPRQALVRELAGAFEAVFIPLQERLQNAGQIGGFAHYCYDGIHPSPAGAALIARAWLEVAGIPDL